MKPHFQIPVVFQCQKHTSISYESMYIAGYEVIMLNLSDNLIKFSNMTSMLQNMMNTSALAKHFLIINHVCVRVCVSTAISPINT